MGRPGFNQFLLQVSDTVTIGADGTAQIQLGPSRVGERWTVNGMTTSSDSDTSQYTPLLTVQRNGHEVVGGSYNANNDTSAGDAFDLLTNDFLRFSLTGGQPGKSWTIVLTGMGYAF